MISSITVWRNNLSFGRDIGRREAVANLPAAVDATPKLSFD
jgi:hypothetical protein